MIGRRLRAILRRLRALLPFHDPSENPVVIVLGTGRSGTTWLAEQLAYAMRGRIIFEPLHPVANPGRDWVGYRKYMRVNDPAPEWRELFDTIVLGILRNQWTDRFNSRFIYHARVVKMIRGNLMLGWLARSYPEARIALVIRDPVDVARSQLRGNWPLEIEGFKTQPKMIEDYPILGTKLVTEAQSQFQLNVLHWAIENRVALDQLEVARAMGAKVEAFSYQVLRDDREQFRAFLIFCGAPATAAAMLHLHRPSRVSRLAPSKIEPSELERAFAANVAKAFDLSDYLSFSADK
jgi:hypothetical protein